MSIISARINLSQRFILYGDYTIQESEDGWMVSNGDFSITAENFPFFDCIKMVAALHEQEDAA